ncbi:hypothetical protein HanRHA438_Chr07g0293681 [Helianthus annuus]|uniref:WRKY domain-containing protein n=1 Tax=Helianthus annuus TaxID=4232 RepID=A0A9K3IIR6_HELAN|nr:hypothetical protein HanXRQr2_Chr07g0283181 [Helianthus annuus]KAJ0549360.1 putative WRKY transcription factor, plant [Helianthus annuus]KAJ0562313.1 putative WRKY transcription factor, plant [Helianthus annuus]KAJ0727689.1 putative WRKY transcription factor, plant [Helianthus annuus]KAJ0730485.1 putative WRKY transcription factor, plant [Helianthus annuus]
MDSGCVYEEKMVIHELTQGLQMAEQLRVNRHSPEARDYFIQMILSSYNNALFALQSGHSAGQPPTPALPTASLPISFGIPGNVEFKFDQHFSSQQGDTIASPFSFPSTSNGLTDEFYSPQFIIPASNFSTEWGSSPSLDFPIDSADVDPDFGFNKCFC